jgi:abhydrolase domain-containing protein 17
MSPQLTLIHVLSPQVNIIAYEYPGYSFAAFDAAGNYRPPSEGGVYAHAHAAYTWATQQQQIQPEDIIIYGRSLGSGAATELASTVASGGLILQSPIASAIRVVARQPFTLPMDIFANIDKIHRVRAPTLIVHGDQDEVVPFRHGNMLFDRLKAARKRHCWIQGAGHNDIESQYWDQFIGAMKAHIDDISNNTPSTAEIHPQQKSGWFSSSSSSNSSSL